MITEYSDVTDVEISASLTPNGEYFLYLGLLFMGLLFIFLGFDTSVIGIQCYGFVYASAICSFLCRKALQGIALSFLDIFSLSFALFFGFGTSMTEAYVLEAEQGVIVALVYTIIALFVAYLDFQWMAWPRNFMYEKGFSARELLLKLDNISLPALTALFLFRLATWAFAASIGLVMSGTGEVMADVDGLTSAFIILSLPFRPFAILVGASLSNHGQLSIRWIARCLFFIELIQSFLTGRRELLFLFFLVAFVSYLKTVRLQLAHLFWGALGAVVMVMVLAPFFYHLRATMQENEVHSAPVEERLSRMLSEVLPDAQATFNLSEMLEKESGYRTNMGTRSYLLTPLTQTVEAIEEGTDYLYGQVLFRAFLLAVPRFLWPGKGDYLMMEDAPTEQFIQIHFGMPLGDVSSTLVWHGYADGGLLGILVYMGIFGLLVGFLQYRLGYAQSVLVEVMIFGMILVWICNVEITVDQVLGDMRLILFLLCVDYFFGGRIEYLTAHQRYRTGWQE